MAALNRNNQNRSVPDWLYTETLSESRPQIEREWDRLLRPDDPHSADAARVARAMFALRSRRPSGPLLARCNERALRWVDAEFRKSREATRLRAVTPDLSIRTRLLIRASRMAMPLAACLLLAITHAGLLRMFDGVIQIGNKLAEAHFDRHIGPMA